MGMTMFWQETFPYLFNYQIRIRDVVDEGTPVLCASGVEKLTSLLSGYINSILKLEFECYRNIIFNNDIEKYRRSAITDMQKKSNKV